MPATEMSDVERIKRQSRHLRGTLEQSLADPVTGALADDDTQVSKFHGIYQQDDRDIRRERKRQKLEPAYSFMIRARVPGGLLTQKQWLNLDQIATEFANDTIRITTRQAIQFHGVIKTKLKKSIARINRQMMDTLAACGDVNRNVMAPPLPPLSAIHRQVQAHAESLAAHLTPSTRAYHEIWLDGDKLAMPEGEVEPIYGDTYLPRKFKAAFVVPPQNDVDVFSQDLGFVAIIEAGELAGFNVMVGGGMGMSHGEAATYPRLADELGFCTPDQVNKVAESVVTTQRDFGDRENRKRARLKYTIDNHGIDWFRDEVERRLDARLGPPRPYSFLGNGDVYGWQQDDAGRWHYTLFVENGRIADYGERRLKSGLRAIAEIHGGKFRLTPNQNVIIGDVVSGQRSEIDALFHSYGIENSEQATSLRRHSLACVAFPTCGLAMAESERYLPSLIDKLDDLLRAHGLADEAITIRMTGCPNGCARPYIAEIGLVGKAPGRYNLYLGAGFAGNRLGCLYRDNADEQEILTALAPLLERYARDRARDERFGDFLIRQEVVPAITKGREFHAAAAND